MKKILICLLSASGIISCSGGSSPNNGPKKLNYPASLATDTTNNYFGNIVADPYQWMESINSDQTLEWVDNQNYFSNSYISKLPEYTIVENLLTQYSTLKSLKNDHIINRHFIKVNDKYYYTKDKKINFNTKPNHRSNFEHVSVDNKIYVTNNINNVGTLFLDLNKLGIINEDESVVQTGVTSDNAYTITKTQDPNLDAGIISVINNDTKELMPNDEIKYSTSFFTIYNDGFFYVKPKNITDVHTSNYNHQDLYYHQIGTSQSTDKLIFSGGEILSINLYPNLSSDIFYFQTNIDTNSQIYSLDPTNMNVPPTMILGDNYKSEFSIANIESNNNLLIQTTQGAAQKRLISVNPNNTESSNWHNILPANNNDIVNAISICGNYYYAEVLVNGASKLYRYESDNSTPINIELPGIGGLNDEAFDCNESTSEFQYQYSNMITPWRAYNYNPNTQISNKIGNDSILGFNSNDYEMKEFFVPSTDGAEISIFIAHKKGIKLDNSNPALIYVYGGFDTAVKPFFDQNNILLLKSGGVSVVAQVRGGGEYGTSWYNSGRLFNKQNTYNDVATVANYIINNGYTNPSKLALWGASNGGITTAITALQNPNLFKVVFPMVGVHDLLRYQLFTNGFTWYSDFGYSSIQDQFNNIMTISPLQNVRNISYPSMLIMAGMEDGRVVPSHSYKFAATMQNSAGGTNPYLLKAYAGQGHGPYNTTEAQIDMWTLFFNQTNTKINSN
ncbi:MAG: prolyl oligopeptidase family serine peptidase [Burkholderiales bacterium]|nr:prolyl oligopeptidase family serine peptidase [Burkholderiales bacterium]